MLAYLISWVCSACYYMIDDELCEANIYPLGGWGKYCRIDPQRMSWPYTVTLTELNSTSTLLVLNKLMNIVKFTV